MARFPWDLTQFLSLRFSSQMHDSLEVGRRQQGERSSSPDETGLDANDQQQRTNLMFSFRHWKRENLIFFYVKKVAASVAGYHALISAEWIHTFPIFSPNTGEKRKSFVGPDTAVPARVS